MQNIILAEVVPQKSNILLKIDKFYQQKKFPETEMSKNSITQYVQKKLILPRNICFDYKKSKEKKQKLVMLSSRQSLPIIKEKPKPLSSNEKICIVKDYLIKKDEEKIKKLSKYELSGSLTNIFRKRYSLTRNLTNTHYRSVNERRTVSMFTL
jgi:hypothetical protein